MPAWGTKYYIIWQRERDKGNNRRRSVHRLTPRPGLLHIDTKDELSERHDTSVDEMAIDAVDLVPYSARGSEMISPIVS